MTDDIVLWSAGQAGTAQWSAHAAGDCGASVLFDPAAAAMRFDFNLVGNGSWAIAHLPVAVSLPEHYVLLLRVRGTMRANQLQLKLVDPSTANVWWWRRSGFAPSQHAQTLTMRRAKLEFAWGPLSGADATQLGAVEIAVAAEEGGPGTLWIEEIRIEPRRAGTARPRIHALRASSHAPARPVDALLDENPEACWRPDGGDDSPWIELDLGGDCEHGGVVVDFSPAAFDAPATRLFVSDDGKSWTMLAQQSPSPSPRVWLRTEEGEGRYARIELKSSQPFDVTRITVVPLELAVSPARFAAEVAARARRGLFPRHLLREQVYWAAVGGDADERKALLSEDGALEVGAESFTIEPFLYVGGRLITWADVETSQSLEDGHLPIPSTQWDAPSVRLRVTAFASGEAGQSVLLGRYQVENLTDDALPARLFLAIRPLQVNPVWQSLNMVGGISPIRRIELLGDVVHVNEAHAVVAVTPPAAFGASFSEDGLRMLEEGRVPSCSHVEDPVGFAAGVLAYDLELDARGRAVVVAAAVPLFERSPVPPASLPRDEAAAWIEAHLADTIARWRKRLSVIPVELPPSARAFEDSLRASIAWVLVNRDGPRIQPGPRSYRRSWIRDGTLTGTALAEMGFGDELRDFLRWYAPYQLEDGRVPCAIDHRSVDLVAEHDSHGQLVWGIVELFRLTRDEKFLREMWPRIRRAVGAIAALRAQERTEKRKGTPCFGLLPESISHEGYSSHPVHAYWDDFFALRALADAAYAAGELGEKEEAARFAALYSEMQEDVRASVALAIRQHEIDFIPGAAELGDLDPGSTAIVFDPCQQASLLPPAALERTFEIFWEQFQQRRQGKGTADAYSAYDQRCALALQALGRPDRLFELLCWFVGDQRPVGWRQWPEVSTVDLRAPRFLGDLPHGWIASGFVRIVRRMLAFERIEDESLVIGAGLPMQWVREAPGVRVRAMPTHYGPLGFTMHAETDAAVRVTFDAGLSWPRGGVVVESPSASPLTSLVVDGVRREASNSQRCRLDLPASEVILKYGRA